MLCTVSVRRPPPKPLPHRNKDGPRLRLNAPIGRRRGGLAIPISACMTAQHETSTAAGRTRLQPRNLRRGGHDPPPHRTPRLTPRVGPTPPTKHFKSHQTTRLRPRSARQRPPAPCTYRAHAPAYGFQSNAWGASVPSFLLRSSVFVHPVTPKIDGSPTSPALCAGAGAVASPGENPETPKRERAWRETPRPMRKADSRQQDGPLRSATPNTPPARRYIAPNCHPQPKPVARQRPPTHAPHAASRHP